SIAGNEGDRVAHGEPTVSPTVEGAPYGPLPIRCAPPAAARFDGLLAGPAAAAADDRPRPVADDEELHAVGDVRPAEHVVARRDVRPGDEVRIRREADGEHVRIVE